MSEVNSILGGGPDVQSLEGVANIPRVDDVPADLVGEHGPYVTHVGRDC